MDKEIELDLRHYLIILWKRRLVVTAVTLVTAVIADSRKLFSSASVILAAEAFTPEAQLSTSLLTNLILAAVVGLVVGSVVAFLAEALRPAPIKATGEMRSGEIAHGEGIRSSESPRP